MKQKIIYLVLAFAALLTVNTFAQKIDNLDIKYTQFTLSNGLTVIVHEDHKAPIVALNIWYHVGSKNEKQGKTGFAHLFEHLMFNGSEHYNDDYFQPMERVGATDLNGTTNNDRTNYFENVPTSALDIALFMESDRMGYMIGAIDQAKLDEQRGVVQNEKRQGENSPYAISEELITKNTYPKGHPYSWTVIGEMEDLDAAKLNDVHDWFKTYYGPNNAVLCIAGDVKPDEIKAKVEKYFGDLPPIGPIVKQPIWVAKMTGEKRQIAQDRVPQSKIYKVWNVPQWGDKELTLLDVTSDILASGKTSRLYKRLVYDEQIATNVQAYVDQKEIGSQFYIEATAKQGVDIALVEKAIDEELLKYIKEGPSEKELKRIKTLTVANFIKGIERIGGFGGKSDILAQNAVYGGSPDYYKNTLKWSTTATSEELKNAAAKWLSDGVYVLTINPYPEMKTMVSTLDRKQFPVIGEQPDAKFPSFQKETLSNGMKIILAERSSIPVVKMTLMVNAGYSADQFSIPGTANLTSAMMDEGIKGKDALEINEELSSLGANLGTGAGLDFSYVTLSALKENLDKSLNIFSEVTLNPTFPQADLDRLKQQTISGIKREKSNPAQMGLRVLPQFFYGKDHAYGLPFTGSGYENTVAKITREDLVKFHDTWFKANNATIVVVGDITMKELKPKLEKLFADWKQGDVPKKNIKQVEQKDKPVIYVLDKPGAPQSIILAGHVIPGMSDGDNIEVESMNNILGGSFTSRINMNLRENKHWSYGSRTMIINTQAQRPLITYALIQTDKTKESIQEIYKEFKGMISDNKVSSDEVDKIKKSQVLELAGSWETMSAVNGSIQNLVMYNLPDNYYETYIQKIKALNTDIITKAAVKTLHPDNIIWVVVGDRAKIEKGLKELNYEIKF
ncbi:MAG: pitrilysin family protein, partial [Bacteroidota bacterium]|nr:pitrilysin family protein [Bacteroidota bacterium]